MERDIKFTTYETITCEVTLGKKSMTMEAWVVSDTLFDCGLFSDEAPDHYSFAKFVSMKNLKETGLIKNLKHKNVDGVAIIRKSIANWLAEDEIMALIHHEGAHMVLGHDGSHPEEEHQEIKKRNPEEEVEIELICQRILLLHPEIIDRANKLHQTKPMSGGLG